MSTKLTLDRLPYDIVRELVPYLDMGYLMSLSQVNRSLRLRIINDNSLWSHLLSQRLDIKERVIPDDKYPFNDVIHIASDRRCYGCKRFEFEAGNAPDSTTGRFFCAECSRLTEFITIPATEAQRHYFLSKSELDELVKLPDARIKRRGNMTYYPRIEVEAAADAKMAAMNTTLAEHRQTMMQNGLRPRRSEMRNRR
jgi:hypothetical protein